MSAFLNSIYQHPLLDHFHQELISNCHKHILFQKGEHLLKQNDISSEYYCIESGLVQCYVIGQENKEITTGFYGSGSIAIESSSLFLRTPTKENMKALTDLVCWRISLRDFQTLYNQIEGFREWGRLWMSSQLFELKSRSLSMITDTARNRYINFIEKNHEILRIAPLKCIASYLGITDTSLSRIRKELMGK
ncbi:MAG: Crp/Fnr family transcriptional regulator [Saprospiraceae bacterium]|nr:Crp/Fnr family transcriptional regulator [Saprospiraceae bacterium]